MPTILRDGPFRFYFYSSDRAEPPHVHVERDDCEAKFWLDPVQLERSTGFAAKDLRQVQRIIEANADQMRGSWDEYFDH